MGLKCCVEHRHPPSDPKNTDTTQPTRLSGTLSLHDSDSRISFEEPAPTHVAPGGTDQQTASRRSLTTAAHWKVPPVPLGASSAPDQHHSLTVAPSSTDSTHSMPQS